MSTLIASVAAVMLLCYFLAMLREQYGGIPLMLHILFALMAFMLGVAIGNLG